MAEFSKQWCEINDPNMGHDFCINDLCENLENNHYTSIICEGFGFLAVGKDMNGEIIVAMPINEDEIEWKLYSEMIREHSEKKIR